ncbi:MAG: response regulator [Alphaproteobacteria bacterium]|nr:response regulator [Alphaproteobacteria bacterium]
MRLLIVDDSRLDRTRIKRLINQMNADISLAEAQDVQTALGMVSVEKFDCILLDYRLPGADGLELAAQIAECHGGVTTPMVMLTGEPSEDLAEHAIGSGFTDFIGKRNLSAEHLRQTLFNAVLKHRNDHHHATTSTNGHGDMSADEPVELSQEERLELADALEVLDRAGLFDQARDDGEEVLQALRKLRDATTTMLVH